MKTPQKPATIFDVAKAAGVSISTVSRVLNNYEHVRPILRTRVLEVMDHMGYVPNRQARRLVGGKSGVLGLLVPALGSEYVGEIVRGIDDELEAVECDLILYTTHRHKAKEDFYGRKIANGLADGLLVVVPIVGEGYLDGLRAANFPHVLVDVDSGDGKSPSVGITNWQGAYDATRYLIELGHRRIGMISDVMELTTTISRVGGYRQALTDHGIAYDSDLVLEDDYASPRTRALTETLLSMPDAPTAIFTTGDVSAFRIMEALRLNHIRIPQDISLVGFDDVPHSKMVYPALTTVHHPLYEMGRMAVRNLLEQIENPGLPPQHILLETRLEIRESCQPPQRLNTNSHGDPSA
jgi:LacI family transcriptional regulator